MEAIVVLPKVHHVLVTTPPEPNELVVTVNVPLTSMPLMLPQISSKVMHRNWGLIRLVPIQRVFDNLLVLFLAHEATNEHKQAISLVE
jgi:hypothetical protein